MNYIYKNNHNKKIYKGVIPIRHIRQGYADFQGNSIVGVRFFEKAIIRSII